MVIKNNGTSDSARRHYGKEMMKEAARTEQAKQKLAEAAGIKIAVKGSPLAELGKKEAVILERKDLKERLTALEVPPPHARNQPLGMLIQGWVEKPPTKENPYAFTVRLPNGLMQEMVLGKEAWTGQQGNLGEGSNRLPVELVQGGQDYRANLAMTIAGTKGQQVFARGQMHQDKANATKTNPHGTRFEVNESVMPGGRPGEYRHDDPQFFKQMGRAVAYDHLARLFPGQIDTSGPIPKFIRDPNDPTHTRARQPSLRAWEHCVATMYGFNDKEVVVPEGTPRKDVGAYARVLFDLFAGYQQTGDMELLTAAMNGLEAHRKIFELKAGDPGAPEKLTGNQRMYKSNELELGSRVGDDIVSTDRGTFHAVPAYLQAYAIAGASEAYAATHSPEALASIVGTMETYRKHFRSADGKGWNRAIIPDAEGMGNPTDARLGDLANHKPWNGLDMVVASGLKFGASLGAPKAGENAQVTEGRRLSNEIIFEGSEVITEQMFKEGKEFVDELLRADGTPITDFRWQQNRGVIGHNFKIAWNLSRMSDHLRTQAEYAKASGDTATAAKYIARADRCDEVAKKVYDHIRAKGIDERNGSARNVVAKDQEAGLQSGQPWGSTTDFWHQEQLLLAAFEMYRKHGDPKYLEDARLVSMMWSEGHLNRTSQSINFSISLNDGLPLTEGDKSFTGRADLGYHQGELAMLANAYNQLYVLKKPIDMNMHMVGNRVSEEVSVRLDALEPGKFELGTIKINGEPFTPTDAERASLQFTIPPEFKGKAVSITAEVQPVGTKPEFAQAKSSDMGSTVMQQGFANAKKPAGNTGITGGIANINNKVPGEG